MSNGLLGKKAPEEFFLRRKFLTTAGGAGLVAAASLILPGKASALSAGVVPQDAELDNTSGDTANEIITAALIAEGLATTFYYNGLIGSVIQDPNLAGPGGTANRVGSNGNQGNVDYLQAAYVEEVAHANFLRGRLGSNSPFNDPVQTFYLPTGTFDNLSSFCAVLDALENAFIGAYLSATIEFAQMATDSRAGGVRQAKGSTYYGARELQWLAQVSASIMGIESEHRVLGRVISNTNPANQLKYEHLDGLTSVYNGSSSAVAALTPFLGPGPGLTAYSYRSALSGFQSFKPVTTGAVPPQPKPRTDGQ